MKTDKKNFWKAMGSAVAIAVVGFLMLAWGRCG